MADTHPDLPIFAIHHLYADTISNVTVLDSQSSVLVNMSVNVATDSAPQAKGHIWGCKNFDVEVWEIQSAVKAVTVLAEDVRKTGGPPVAWGTMPFLKRFGCKVPGEEGWENWVWDPATIQAKL